MNCKAKKYDVLIIGGGPAGLTAAIYTSRAGLSTLVLDKPGRILDKVQVIENYLGFPEGISGSELLRRGREQARKFGAEIIEEEVLMVRMRDDESFVVEAVSNEYEAKGLIIATGIKHEKPRIEGLERLEGRGVSYCVTCDAPFFKGKKVGVIGSKNYAAKEALELLNYTKDVTIYTNGQKLEIDPKLKEALQQRGIPIKAEKIERILGDKKLEGLQLESGKEKLDGVFVAMGTSGATDFARSLGILIEGDKIIVDENLSTGIPRVYAAGDCIGGPRQLAKATGDGVKAAINLITELKGLKREFIDWKKRIH